MTPNEVRTALETHFETLSDEDRPAMSKALDHLACWEPRQYQRVLAYALDDKHRMTDKQRLAIERLAECTVSQAAGLLRKEQRKRKKSTAKVYA